MNVVVRRRNNKRTKILGSPGVGVGTFGSRVSSELGPGSRTPTKVSSGKLPNARVLRPGRPEGSRGRVVPRQKWTHTRRGLRARPLPHPRPYRATPLGTPRMHALPCTPGTAGLGSHAPERTHVCVYTGPRMRPRTGTRSARQYAWSQKSRQAASIER